MSQRRIKYIRLSNSSANISLSLFLRASAKLRGVSLDAADIFLRTDAPCWHFSTSSWCRYSAFYPRSAGTTRRIVWLLGRNVAYKYSCLLVVLVTLRSRRNIASLIFADIVAGISMNLSESNEYRVRIIRPREQRTARRWWTCYCCKRNALQFINANKRVCVFCRTACTEQSPL